MRQPTPTRDNFLCFQLPSGAFQIKKLIPFRRVTPTSCRQDLRELAVIECYVLIVDLLF